MDIRLIKSKNAEINYLAKIVKLDSFTKHPDPEVTKLKIAHVDGYNIIVGIDSKPGLYIYFPTMSAINPAILSFLNLYSNCELNDDNTKKGFFGKNGKVKAIKLRGTVSEGFLLEYESLQKFVSDNLQLVLPEYEDGLEFDTLEYNGKTIWINEKFIVKNNNTSNNNKFKETKGNKNFDKLIENQFYFHYDTILIKKCKDAIKANDIIQLSSKWNGTSAITSNILCKQELPIWDKLYMKLCNLFNLHTTFNSYKYDIVYSSRHVIKNKYINKDVNDGFYGCDVWKYAADYIKSYIPKGYTLYYEIVGYTPDGQFIQKGFDYGCVPPTNGDYIYNVNYKIYIYRITYVNVDGAVYEYSTQEVQRWCKERDFLPVNQLYYGKAGDLYPDIPDNDEWFDNFINRLADDKNFFMECDSPDCKLKVPHEGLVIKKDSVRTGAYKLKCFRFLNKEQKLQDDGITNMEDDN